MLIVLIYLEVESLLIAPLRQQRSSNIVSLSADSYFSLRLSNL